MIKNVKLCSCCHVSFVRQLFDASLGPCVRAVLVQNGLFELVVIMALHCAGSTCAGCYVAIFDTLPW